MQTHVRLMKESTAVILEETDVGENFPKKHLLRPVIRTHFKILKPIYCHYKQLSFFMAVYKIVSSLQQIELACLPSTICNYVKSRVYLAFIQIYKSSIKEQHRLLSLIILMFKIKLKKYICKEYKKL